jgi:putative transposase
MIAALSALPVTPPPAPRGVEWLTVEQAAKRSGWSERTITRSCGSKWFALGFARPDQIDGRAKWMIRADADVRFARIRFADSIPADLKHLTDDHRKRVMVKVAIVREWETYTDAARDRGQGNEAATACFLEELIAGLLPVVLLPGMKLPTDRTLRNWRSAHRKDGLNGLIDERGTRQTKPTDEDPFFECVKFYLLDQRQRTKQMCWELACKQAELSGWMTRSYKQTLRYIAAMPHQVLEFHRKGPKKANGTSAKYIERDYSTLRSNEVWCCDEHTFDVWVKYRGDVVRPFLTAFEDMRSRKIVGWIITPRSADTDSVLSALHKGCVSHGVPERIYADNGKVFDCAALQGQTKRMRFGKIAVDSGVMAGVLGGLNITMTHATAYNAKAKPIERFFGTVCDRFSKLQPTYCGGTTSTRPENLKSKLERGIAPELADFFAAFEMWLAGDYHARAHTGDAMNGKTPAAVFDECLVEKKTAPDAVLEVMLWKPSRPTKYTRNGVLCDGIGYGNREAALFAWTGKEVIVRVDPANAGRAAICEPNGRLICFAPSNIKLPFNTPKAELKEATANLTRAKKQTREHYKSRPQLHGDVAGQLYADRAEADRVAREAAKVTPPTIAMVNTPLNDQLPALQRALEKSAQPTASNKIDLYADDAPQPTDRRADLLSFAKLMEATQQKLDDEMEAERAAERDANELFRKAFANREAEAG